MKIVALLLLLLSLPTKAVEVVINESNTNIHSITSRAQLYDIFTLRVKYWDNFDPLVVVYLPFDAETHKEFVNNYLDTNRIRLKRLIEVRGKDNSNYIMTSSESEALTEISKHEGYIGYLSDEIVFNVRGDVKRVHITFAP